jgi:hypothetical protein
MMHPLTPVWDILMYVVMPLWVIAGFADYLCHRASGIEHASGTQESLIHWLMLGEVGLPLMAALFLKVNALLMVFMLVCLVIHEVTGHLDLRLAMRTRNVTAFEQQIHSFLEILPLTALLLLFVLHWPQAEALFGFGPEHADWTIGSKEPPHWSAMIPPFAAFALLAIFPYAEELCRGFLTRSKHALGFRMEVTPPEHARLP